MTDQELKRHVEDALTWEPGIDQAAIGVSVDNGVVTLRGDVGTYTEKSAVERVTLAVYGVKAVANDLNVRLTKAYERTDTDIAQAAASALEWSTVVPSNRVTVAVSNGLVTLKGNLDLAIPEGRCGPCGVRPDGRSRGEQQHHCPATGQDRRDPGQDRSRVQTQRAN